MAFQDYRRRATQVMFCTAEDMQSTSHIRQIGLQQALSADLCPLRCPHRILLRLGGATSLTCLVRITQMLHMSPLRIRRF